MKKNNFKGYCVVVIMIFIGGSFILRGKGGRGGYVVDGMQAQLVGVTSLLIGIYFLCLLLKKRK